MNPALRLVYFGSSEFSIPPLKALVNSGFELLVVSHPAKAKGRRLKIKPNQLLDSALNLKLNTFTPANIQHPETYQIIRDFNPDFLITASYGSILKESLLKLAPKSINLHPSILPLLRGATPIQSAILQGFESTGVSIFEMVPQMDAGPILHQKKLKIEAGENYSSLHDRLADLAAQMLTDYLKNPDACPPQAQNDNEATYCHKFTSKDRQIDWTHPAYAIHRQIRAFSQSPGAWTICQETTLKIISAEYIQEHTKAPAGQLINLVKNKGFTIACGDAPLMITKVQPAGKKIMDAWAYQLGARINPGVIFGS